MALAPAMALSLLEFSVSCGKKFELLSTSAKLKQHDRACYVCCGAKSPFVHFPHLICSRRTLELFLIAVAWFGHATGIFVASVCRNKEVQELVAVAVAGWSGCS